MEHLERLEAIDKAIAEAIDALDLKKDLVTHLSVIDHKRSRLKEKVNKLFAFVDQEKANFEILETNSIVPLFFKVLGVYKGRYDQEQQDFVQAALNYNAALDQLHLLDFELKIVKKKLARLEKKKIDIEKLLKEKQQIYNVNDAKIAREIGEFDTDIYTHRKRITNAHKLQLEIDVILEDLQFILDTIVSTGAIILKGGSSRKFLPYKNIKGIKLASRAATRAQNNLDNFNIHLREYDPEIRTNKIFVTQYLDSLFEQLIKDWVAHYYFKSSEKKLKSDIEILKDLRKGIDSNIKVIGQHLEYLIVEKREYLIAL